MTEAKDVKDFVTKFADGTTAHGVPQLIKAQSRTSKIFWALVCVSVFVLFTWQACLVIMRYFGYQKQVDEVLIPKSAVFPLVSVCSIEPINRYDMGRANTKRAELFRGKKINHGWDLDSDQFLRVFYKFLKDEKIITPSFRNNYLLWKTMYNVSYDRLLDASQDLYHRESMVTNVGRNHVQQMGIGKKHMIWQCLFDGKDCGDFANFKTIFHPYFYNCYTYDSNRFHGDSDHTGSEHIGLLNGLSLTLKTNSGWMWFGNTDIKNPLYGIDGLRVIIHPPNTFPHPQYEGFNIRGGTHISVAVKQHKLTRLGSPYGNCSTERFQMDGGMYDYRLLTCQANCQRKIIQENCGCMDPYSIPKDRIPKEGPGQLQPCTIWPNMTVLSKCLNDSTSTECMAGLKEKLEYFECRKHFQQYTVGAAYYQSDQCQCFSPCHEIQYDTQLNTIKWPESYPAEYLFDQILGPNLQKVHSQINDFNETFHIAINDLNIPNWNAITKEMKRNTMMQCFARLNLYLTDSNVRHVYEVPSYSAEQFLSDVGGQLSLWIGVSMVTVFEFVHLILQIVTHNKDKEANKKETTRC